MHEPEIHVTKRSLQHQLSALICFADGKRVKLQIWDTAGQERYFIGSDFIGSGQLLVKIYCSARYTHERFGT